MIFAGLLCFAVVRTARQQSAMLYLHQWGPEGNDGVWVPTLVAGAVACGQLRAAETHAVAPETDYVEQRRQ